MNISGIGNTGTDYSRYATRQLEQEAAQQESLEQQAEQATVVSQSAQPQAADTNAGQAQTQSQTQAQTSEVAAISSSIAQSLTTESDDDETSNQTLINKANSGAELTQSELAALKDIDPALYSQAMKAKTAREDLRSQMSQRPANAMQTAHEAISQYLDSDGEDAQSVVRKALADEYKTFSSKYDQMEFSAHLYEI